MTEPDGISYGLMRVTVRKCWTCNTRHDLDQACPAAPAVRSMRSAGQPGNELADHTSPDLFNDLDESPVSQFGPVFLAEFESDSACCGEPIQPGEDIRADGQGGWIHADAECERLAQEE